MQRNYAVQEGAQGCYKALACTEYARQHTLQHRAVSRAGRRLIVTRSCVRLALARERERFITEQATLPIAWDPLRCDRLHS